MTATILMIGPFPPPVHGASLVTARLAERLRGHMTVATRDISPGVTRGIAYHLTRIVRVVAAIAGVLTAPRGAWVYLSAAGGSGLIYTAGLAAAARLTGHPLIVHHHSFAYINRRSVLMAAVAFVAGRRALHLALCPRMAERLAALYPRAARTTVLTNAFLFAPTDEKRIAAQVAPLRLGHLSNLSREKGLQDVLNLQARLAQSGVASELSLVGAVADSGDAATLAAAVAASGGRVRHLGPLYDAAKDSFLAGLDVFLFPSRYVNEAEPLVVFEAMAHGLPVLAYDRGCIAEQLGVEGGVVYGADADFAAEAGARLAAWAADDGQLRAAQAAARRRMATLSSEASGQFANFLTLLGVSAESASGGAR